jgi:hypothetical protein
VVLLRRGYLEQMQAYNVQAATLPCSATMAPFQCFRVEASAFRREPLPAIKTGGEEEEGAGAVVITKERHRPIQCWLLLRQLAPEVARGRGGRGGYAPYHQFRRVCVPLHLEDTLPEYLVPLKTFNAAMQRLWQPGDVFRMFFAADEGDGHYYKGVVIKVSVWQCAWQCVAVCSTHVYT